MKKIAIFTFLLCLAAVSFASAKEPYCPNPNADQLGVTVHYSPTDFQFVQGIKEWTYDQDMVSLGLYALIHIDDNLSLLVKNRFIFGSEETGNDISLVGNKTEMRFSANEFIVATYSFTAYFPSNKVSPIYEMCSPDNNIHRLGFDINVPILQSDTKR